MSSRRASRSGRAAMFASFISGRVGAIAHPWPRSSLSSDGAMRSERSPTVAGEHSTRRTIRIDLEYDGSDFRGFAPQPGLRTIGGEIEAGLQRVLQAPIRVTPAGRTDTGVHARGQVVSFQTVSRMPVVDLKRALNALVGEDVLVRSVADVPAGFDARRSARSRRYRYAIWNAPDRDVWHRRWTTHVEAALDADAMDTACQALVGRHDFAAFRTHAAQDEPRSSTVRSVFRAEWRHDPSEPRLLAFDIEADAFLRHMVRSIVGSSVLVGRERLPVTGIEAIMGRTERAAAGPTAPAGGLTLVEVKYEVVGVGGQVAPSADRM
ncbi:MAG: tRNA pseudouridine(38-40) synthase TruA [Chloroflexi bacterium]|nr:tRNA pseudouridine(38-40) synthase TruA [Chloroflexota bacterium]